jgi:hypothetical protein
MEYLIVNGALAGFLWLVTLIGDATDPTPAPPPQDSVTVVHAVQTATPEEAAQAATEVEALLERARAAARSQ